MKLFILLCLLLLGPKMLADTLPVFTVQPTNQIVSPGSTATLVAAATGATSYQWRFNGADIIGATGAALQVVNAQTTNAGYYLAIAKNATGWVPSQMVWLAVVHSNGLVPFSNLVNSNNFLGQAVSQYTSQPINHATAQVMAGPALDQMNLIAISGPNNQVFVTNGFFNLHQLLFDNFPFPSVYNTNLSIPNVDAGQTVYYAVYITYTNGTVIYTQPSTVISMVAGGNGYPIPSGSGLKFPIWLEWPEPQLSQYPPPSATNRTYVLGETFSLTNYYYSTTDLGVPTFQWRKNGITIGSPQSFIAYYLNATASAVLTITNAQPSDAGVYDVVVLGDNWFIGPKMLVSIQTTNGQGVFQTPGFAGTNFVCALAGAAGRNYKVQQSTNLLNWSDLVTLSNATGTVTFTNATAAVGAQFYRTVLLP